MTRAVLSLAGKDLRLLLRNRGGLFFALGWPILMSLFFGMVFGGGGGGGKIPVAVVDEDGTAASAALVERLRATEGLEVTSSSREEAEGLVRAGKRSGAVFVPRGYGESADRVFHGEPRRLEIALDPSRQAEGAMLEGLLTGAAMRSFQEVFTDRERGRTVVDRALGDLGNAPDDPDRAATRRFLGELRAYLDRPEPREAGATPASAAARAWTPVEVTRRELRADRGRPSNAFEVTFPQGVLWGVIGCSLTFALSLVVERTRGTLLRLRVAPLSRAQILAGKALACLAAIVAVEALLFGLGRAAFGVAPGSWLLLGAAGLSVAICFVGIMMIVAAIGRTEQSAGGLGWAIMMPLTMFGGGMIPLFAMPGWMRTVGNASPVKWGILALEGALWRGFGAAELAVPCAILVAVGLIGFGLGARAFAAQE